MVNRKSNWQSCFTGKLAIYLLSAFLMIAFVGCNGDDDDDAGTIAVDSNPQGASIFINGDYQSKQTPASFELDAGDYVIKASIPGSIPNPDSQIVDLASGAEEDVFFTFEEDTSAGYIMVSTNPEGAYIYLDGALFHYTTPYSVPASAGEHEVRVEKSGFISATEAVEVTSSVTTNLDFGDLTGRRIALIEDFTNVYCTNCPDATENVMNAIESGYADRVILLEYHPSDGGFYDRDVFFEINPDDNNGRFHDFYSVSGVPRVYVGGTLINGVTEEGGNILVTNAIDNTLAETHSLDLWGSWNDSKEVSISARATASINAKIWGFVYRKDVHFDEAPGSNGLTDFHRVVYDVFPGDADRNVSLSSGTTETYDFTFDIADSLLDSDLIGISIIVQDDEKHVYQAVDLINQ